MLVNRIHIVQLCNAFSILFFILPLPYYVIGISDKILLGVQVLIYGCWEGILVIMIAMISINLLKVRLAIKIGAIGCILMGINLISIFIVYLSDISSNTLYFGFFIGVGLWIMFCVTHLALFSFKRSESNEEEMRVRKIVLDLSTKFTRLKIKEIHEKSGVDYDFIIHVVRKMIDKQAIYGELFMTSKSIVFNQQANIDEIDNLMAKYQEWESEILGKKI